MSRKNARKQLARKRAYFRLKAPEAKEVVLTGSFNDWDINSRHLKQGKKGI